MIRRSASILLAGLALALPLRAQSMCTETGPPCTTPSGTLMVNITIGRALQLVVSPTATVLTSPTALHYNNGRAATTGPTATVRSNAPWTLAISAAASTWSATDTQTQPARTNKPASDLLWSTSSSGTFLPLTLSPVSVVSGNATAGSTPTTFYYETLYNWTLDTPGQYSLQIVFTISSP